MKKMMNFKKRNYAYASICASILFMCVSCSSDDDAQVVTPVQTPGQIITSTRWQTTEVFVNGGIENKIVDYPGTVSVSTWRLTADETNSGTFEFRNVSDPEGTPRAQGSFELKDGIRILTFPNGSTALATMTRLDSGINEYTQSLPEQVNGVPVQPQNMVIVRVVHKQYPLK